MNYNKKEHCKYWFTADEHYGDFIALEAFNRPFRSVDEMDSKIIQNSNALISNSDIIIHVGDFTLLWLESAQNYLKQLKGQHIFIQGNHENWLIGSNIKSSTKLKINIDGIDCFIAHIPLMDWPGKEKGVIHIHGHIHGKFGFNSALNRFDVGVDCNNFKPVNFKEISKNIL